MHVYAPIGDNRFFTAGNDAKLLEHIPLYSGEEYEQEYPRISSTMPEMFSLNLRQEIVQFLALAPPQFGVHLDSVLEVGCFYYCDWETVVAVTDEFITAEAVTRVRQSLEEVPFNGKSVDERMEELIVMLGSAVKGFIGVIIGVLSRTGAPAIMDYGCCYRFSHVDKLGNVFFHMRNPTQVYAELDELNNKAGAVSPDRQHCGNF